MSKIPNVILRSVDALRASHPSSYGYERETNPEIDALTARGTQFVNAFLANPRVHETILSLLTGRRPNVFTESGYRLVTDHESKLRLECVSY